MTAFNEVVDYLKDKVRATSPTHPKANTGAQLLRLYPKFEEEVEYLLDKAIHTLQVLFTRDETQNPAGTAMLTNASQKIGATVGRRIKYEPIPTRTQLRLGDLFIEALYNCGYVDLYYPQRRDASHIVSASATWVQLGDMASCKERTNLYATVMDKPEDIQGPLQSIKEVDYPIIKGRYKPIDITQPWLRSINKLQQTGWRINQRVLDTMVKNQDFFISEDPIEDNDAKEQKRRSKLVEWGYLTAKAKKLYNEDCFYQYVDVDYRGRIYYIESFLNFQGSDLARGLMQFARAKPMTKDGLYWLAIHTASVFNMSYNIDEIPDWCEEDYHQYLKEQDLESISVDKMTLNDRVQWTHEYMDDIRYAGKNLEFSEDAEKPISFLSACIEWHDYFQAQDQNRMHMTYLPIPIDGSNNGWQHLGAISKDQQTGELVGLVPVSIQKDFYVQTAKELIAINQDDRLQEILDAMPMKSIRKGISKRGSMTRAYSAGAKKISENMYFDCKAEDYHEEYGITEEDCNKFAKLLIRAIDSVCPGPLQTMTYLQHLAGYQLGEYARVDVNGEKVDPKALRILKERQRELYLKERSDEEDEELNDIRVELTSHSSQLVRGKGAKEISWLTPSGFSVIYENWKMQKSQYKGTIAGYTDYHKDGRVNHVIQEASDIPDTRGFMCGISPNYIHSQDAAHMAVVIDEWNGDFGAVHDSFSTHACDVDRLLLLTKDVFVRMYDDSNYFNVIRSNLTNNDDDVDQPSLGTLDIGGIYDSEYFFA